MDTIKITDNPQEMVDIARQIIAEKPGRYTPDMLEVVEKSVRHHMGGGADEALVRETALKTIYFYWVYGSTADEYFYYRLPERSHEERKTYATFQERNPLYDFLDPPADRHLLVNKYEAYRFFGPEAYKRDMIQCVDDAEWPLFRKFVEKHPVFVVKPTDMAYGNGVHTASVEGMDESQLKECYRSLLGEYTTNKTKYHMAKRRDSIIFEELIDQADELAEVHPASANGIRATTVRLGDKVVLYQPWWKIGRGGQFVTSAVYGTFDAGIDPETGVVETLAFSEALEKIERHPDTGFQIHGFQIPRWRELVEMVTELALKLPTLRYVGWDMVLSKKGWCVMEGNAKGDFMWQLFRERGMKREFEELIGFWSGKEFWWQGR